MAKKCDVAIIPIGSGFDRAWTFEKAWDKFQIPKPFSKAALVLGEPYIVPKDMAMEDAIAELTRILHQTEQQALDLVTNTK